MLHHIVLFQTKDTIDEVQLAEIMADFAALSTHIPEIIQLNVRRNILPPESRRPVSSHYGLMVQLADLDALNRYHQHPEHIGFFERIRPHIEQMQVLDYEL